MSEREIFCEECWECAIEVDASALGEDLDGIHCVCQGCKVGGKIVYLDDGDEGGAYSWLKFRKLTEREESELVALAGRDEVELEVDRMFRDTDAEEIAAAMIEQGYVERWMSQDIARTIARIGDEAMEGLGDEGRKAIVAMLDRCIDARTGPGLAKCGPKKRDLLN